MRIRVGISGFDRTGRLVLRQLAEEGDAFEVVGIRDLASADTLARLFKHDSVYGHYSGDVRWDAQHLIVDGTKIDLLTERDPSCLRWNERGADIVMETSGLLTYRERDLQPGYDSHIRAGARKVLLAYLPRTAADQTCVIGVNHDNLAPEHACVSLGTRSVNALAPVMKVLDDQFGVDWAFVQLLRPYTGNQPPLDFLHSDPYAARSVTQNIVPTPQASVNALGMILPVLMGKIQGRSYRVPVAAAGMVEATVRTSRAVVVEDVNAAMKRASEGPLRGILGFTDDPLVSSDIRGDNHSATIAGSLTQVWNDHLLNVVAWYDYEWAYCCRCVDMMRLLGQL